MYSSVPVVLYGRAGGYERFRGLPRPILRVTGQHLHLYQSRLRYTLQRIHLALPQLLSTSDEIGREQHLRTDQFCIEWDEKP